MNQIPGGAIEHPQPLPLGSHPVGSGLGYCAGVRLFHVGERLRATCPGKLRWEEGKIGYPLIPTRLLGTEERRKSIVHYESLVRHRMTAGEEPAHHTAQPESLHHSSGERVRRRGRGPPPSLGMVLGMARGGGIGWSPLLPMGRGPC